MSQKSEIIKKLMQSKKVGRTKTKFENLLVIYLGTPIKEHYPNEKNVDGTTKKDTKGNAVKSDKSDGYSCYYSEYGTSRKIMVVTKEKPLPELSESYIVNGSGYDLRSANLAIVESEVSVAKIDLNAGA